MSRLTKLTLTTIFAWQFFLPWQGDTALAQEQETVKEVVNRCLVDYPDKFEVGDVSRALQKDPKAAVQAISAALAGIDVTKQADFGKACAAIGLLSGIPIEEAIKELDRLYGLFQVKDDDAIGRRHAIIQALQINSLGGRQTLLQTEPSLSLACLEKWLKTESSRYVLRYGLRVLSAQATELHFDVLKNAKEQLPEGEVAVALRKVKLNGLKDYSEIYREVMAWFDQLLQEIDKDKVDGLDTGFTELKSFLLRSLQRDPKGLQTRRPDVKGRIERINTSITALDAKIKMTESKTERKRLGLQQDNYEQVRNSLQWVIGKD